MTDHVSAQLLESLALFLPYPFAAQVFPGPDLAERQAEAEAPFQDPAVALVGRRPRRAIAPDA